MAARWIALLLGGITLAIVGFFMAVALWPRAETLVSRDASPALNSEAKQMANRAWVVTARFEQLPSGVQTTLSIQNDAGRLPAGLRAPVAEFRMLEMPMSPVPAVLDLESSGRWRSLTRLPMPGRWSLVVTVEGEELAFPFSAPAGQT